ncbi:MAG: hypothetical protein ACRBBP_07240 [Bdellovibrionales bacterium]
MKTALVLLLTTLVITACDDSTPCEEPMNSMDMSIPEYIYTPASTENQCSTYAEDYINSEENLYTYQNYCSNDTYTGKIKAGFKTADDALIDLSGSIDEAMVADYINTYCRPYDGPAPDAVNCFEVEDDSISYHYTYDGYKFKGEITIAAITQGTCPLYTISCYTRPDNTEGDACENMED